MNTISLREVAYPVFLLVFYSVGASILFLFCKAEEVLADSFKKALTSFGIKPEKIKSAGLFVAALIGVALFFLMGAIGNLRSLITKSRERRR